MTKEQLIARMTEELKKIPRLDSGAKVVIRRNGAVELAMEKREGVMEHGHGQESWQEKNAKVLNPKQAQELHVIARNMKSIYVRFVQLMHELDIPFKL